MSKFRVDSQYNHLPSVACDVSEHDQNAIIVRFNHHEWEGEEELEAFIELMNNGLQGELNRLIGELVSHKIHQHVCDLYVKRMDVFLKSGSIRRDDFSGKWTFPEWRVYHTQNVMES